MDKKSKKAWIIDIAIPGDTRVNSKEEEKIERYGELAREVKKLWKLKGVKVVPIVIGELGTTPKNLEMWLKEIGLNIKIGLLQKVAQLGSARILRKVMDCRMRRMVNPYWLGLGTRPVRIG